MADLGDTFDPNAIPEDERNFDPVPAGEYLLQVVESDLNRKGNNEMLKLTIDVMDGPFANRKIFENLNIRHENPTAQGIAQRALADLCIAVGVAGLRNSEELHFKPFIGRVKIQEDKTGQYGPQNRIARYRPRSNQPPAAKNPTSAPAAAHPQPSGQSQPAANTASRSSRPWARQTA
jgi:hypothetical protein